MAESCWGRSDPVLHCLSGGGAPVLEQNSNFGPPHGRRFHCHFRCSRLLGLPHAVRPAALIACPRIAKLSGRKNARMYSFWRREGWNPYGAKRFRREVKETDRRGTAYNSRPLQQALGPASFRYGESNPGRRPRVEFLFPENGVVAPSKTQEKNDRVASAMPGLLPGGVRFGRQSNEGGTPKRAFQAGPEGS